MALLHLTAAWSKKRDYPVVVYSVDHGLREHAHREAVWACAQAQALGLPAEILTWKHHRKVYGTGIQEQARQARYTMMALKLKQAGGCLLLTGHTRDDQMETFIFRMLRQKNWRGWAALHKISPYPIWPEGEGLWLARPLLDMQRKDLRVFLQTRGVTWIEDESNENTVFARTRIRKDLKVLSEKGFNTDRFLGLHNHVTDLKACEYKEAVGIIRKGVTFHPEGYACLDPHIFRACSPGPGKLAFGVALVCVSGRESVPRDSALTRLFQNFTEGQSYGGTLHGVRLVITTKGCFLTRDPGDVLGRGSGPFPSQLKEITPHQALIWDGRFSVITHEKGINFKALGGHEQQLNETARVYLKRLPACVRPLLPAFFRGETLMAVPFLKFKADHGVYLLDCLVQRRAAFWLDYALSFTNNEEGGIDREELMGRG